MSQRDSHVVWILYSHWGPEIRADKFQASQMVLVVKNLPASAGDVRDVGSIPRLGRSPGGENGNPLQYPCLGNHMDRGA